MYFPCKQKVLIQLKLLAISINITILYKQCLFKNDILRKPLSTDVKHDKSIIIYQLIIIKQERDKENSLEGQHLNFFLLTLLISAWCPKFFNVNQLNVKLFLVLKVSKWYEIILSCLQIQRSCHSCWSWHFQMLKRKKVNSINEKILPLITMPSVILLYIDHNYMTHNYINQLSLMIHMESSHLP